MFCSVQTDPGLPQLQGWVGYHEVRLQRLLDKGVQEAGGQPENKPSGKTNKRIEKLNGECLINSILNLSILCHRVHMFCKTTSFVCWLSSPVGSSTWIRLLRLACNFSYMHVKQIHPRTAITLSDPDPVKSFIVPIMCFLFQYLAFSCGVVRGALSNLGLDSVVTAEVSVMPSCKS